MTIGFKEWALVCQALVSGESSLIIRKGGIAEGRDGFRFKHDSFFLFPTLFHEQIAKTRLPAHTPLPAPQPGHIRITGRAVVEWTALITDPALLEKLQPLHILRPSVVEERFHYDPQPGQIPGVHLAFLRVSRASEPWIFPDAAKYGGCRSWLDLPDPPAEIAWLPALSEAAHQARAAELRAILG